MVGRKQSLASKIFVYGALILLIILWTIPTLGLLVTSFRPADDVLSSGWWTVVKPPFEGSFTLSNYRVVLGIASAEEQAGAARLGGAESLDFLAAILNTLTVSIPATVIPILIAAFAAYGFAWIRFPGRGVLFIAVVALLVVPLQIALIPILKDYVALDLGGTFLGVWMAHTGFGLPLAVYLLYNYIATLPRDIFESAFIDGASHFTIFIRLVLHLSVPALA
jgi:alpha-glucoside transport system permease protein